MNRKKYIILFIPIIMIIIGVVFLVSKNKYSYGILKEGKGFTSYEFDMLKMDPYGIEKVSDGYIMLSTINNDIDASDDDIRITKYDKNFKRLWSYDYIHDEQNYIVQKTEKKENENLLVYVEKMIEKDDKLFFIITVSSSSTGYSNTRLLILNKNGSLYDDHRFKESIDSMVSIENETITLYNTYQLYEYNYKTRKITEYNMDNFEESSFRIINKNNDEYLIESSINYYIDDNEDIVEGTNSLYLLDGKFNTKKSLNLDEIMGVKGENIDYDDARMIDENIYVSYFIYGEDESGEYDEEENENTYGYPGLLIVDKDFNIINNIKYTHEITKKKFKELADYEIYDYYVYNDELYILIGWDKLLIDKYDKNGRELSSKKTKISVPKEMGDDSYSSSEYKIIDYDEKKIIYYSIFSDDYENVKKKVYKSILKFEKIEL